MARALTRAALPRRVQSHWSGEDPARWVTTAAAAHVDNPLMLPLTRLSGSLVFPVLNGAHVAERADVLQLALVSVIPPRQALRELLPLRAYGPTVVLLPPAAPHLFFDIAELDMQGVGVVAAEPDGAVRSLVRPEPHPRVGRLAPWWRAERQDQLLHLAGF